MIKVKGDHSLSKIPTSFVFERCKMSKFDERAKFSTYSFLNARRTRKVFERTKAWIYVLLNALITHEAFANAQTFGKRTKIPTRAHECPVILIFEHTKKARNQLSAQKYKYRFFLIQDGLDISMFHLALSGHACLWSGTFS